MAEQTTQDQSPGLPAVCTVRDEEGTRQIPLTVRVRGWGPAVQIGDTNVVQLLVKAKALNSESSMGVTHLLETQVWGALGMCTTCIRPVSIYLLGCCISIPSFSPAGHRQDELGYKCFLKFYRNFLAYYTVDTSHLTSLP